MRQKRSRTEKLRRIAVLGSLLALAFGFGYLEFLIPFDAAGIPGVKLGLANLAVLAALYWLGPLEACAVSFVRILLSWLVFGNFVSFIYSICGGAVSLAVMILFQKLKIFDELGVSVCGAVAHNTGQMIAASFLTGTSAIWFYYPVLLVFAVLTGALIGWVFRLLNRRLYGKITGIASAAAETASEDHRRV